MTSKHDLFLVSWVLGSEQGKPVNYILETSNSVRFYMEPAERSTLGSVMKKKGYTPPKGIVMTRDEVQQSAAHFRSLILKPLSAVYDLKTPISRMEIRGPNDVYLETISGKSYTRTLKEFENDVRKAVAFQIEYTCRNKDIDIVGLTNLLGAPVADALKVLDALNKSIKISDRPDRPVPFRRFEVSLNGNEQLHAELRLVPKKTL